RDARPRLRRDAGAVHGRRDHGVLQRPDSMRRPRRAGGADGAGDPRRREKPRRRLAAQRVRPRRGNRYRAEPCDARPDRLRGSFRLRRHRQRHQSGRPAVFGRRALAGIGHRSRARWHRARGGGGNGGRCPAQRIQSLSASSQHQRTQGRKGRPMTQLQAPNQLGRTLSELDEDERYRYFDALQLTMPDVWESMRLNLEDESVVVVPSISIERTTPGSGTVMQAMEERALFLLLLLRQPRLRMIYVTSQPISESIIEYYLGLLPGVIPSHARARLTLVPVGDASTTALSAKLLARPRLIREIRSLIPNAARSHLIPYNTTPLERDVALSLRIPMYGADPRLEDLGSKTGCRRMFEECGVQYPIGAEDLHTVDDIVAAVQGMRARRPSIKHAIVKINEGVSGSGNASMDLDDLPTPGAPEEAAAIAERLQQIRPESEKLTVPDFLTRFEKGGGIVEERTT